MYGHREKYLSLLVSKMKFFNLSLQFLIHVSFKQSQIHQHGAALELP